MKNFTISQKLTLSLILISILPYAVLSYINYSEEKNSLEKNIFDDLNAVAEAKRTHISTVVSLRIEQVARIATSNFMQEIEKRNTQYINLNLLRIKNEIPAFLEISALDSNGIVVASTENKLINSSYAEEEFYKKAKDNLYLGSIGYYDNKTAYTISHPVLNVSTGKLIGVVAVRIYPLLMYEVTGDYTGLGESGESLLVQKRGNEVVFLNPLRHNPEAALNLRFPLDSELAKPAILASQGNKGNIRALDYRGKEVFAAYTYVPEADMGLVVKIDASEALMPVVAFRERTVALGIFYFAVVIALSYLFGRRFSAPLVRLSDASKKVAKGYLMVHIEPESRDEIGELARSFNFMVEKLKELYEGMELKVKERTKELVRHHKTIEALYAIDRAVSQTLDMESILGDALSKAMEVTETDTGGIYLLDENGETLGLKAHSGLSPELVNTFSKIKVGQGVSGMAVSSGKPVALDIANYPSPELLAPLIKEGIISIASAPLIAKGKVVGAISLSYKSRRTFSNDDLDLLASIGSQIGVAIQNATLFSELERHHKMLQALYAIESVVSKSLDIDEIFNVALSKALEVTDAEAGTLYSFDGEVLHLEAFKGLSPEFKEKALIRKIGDGIPGIAAQSKKPVTMDISQFPSPHLLPYVKKEGLVSFIGTPLMFKEKLVGALSLGTKKRRVFTEDDLELLFSIGNAIGIAVENAQLYKESRENLENLKAAYDELQTLDKMKDEFISVVSHELKTPLISIKGYGEVLYDEKIGKLKEEQKKSLEAILRNTERLTRLIDSILFLSKLQAGKIEFHFEPLALGEIVEMCAGDFKGVLDRKRIALEIEMPGISKVNGDRDRLIEVISNLLDNAVKFTPEGGKISIKARDEGENVHLEVKDTGIGIPPEIIPKLFTRFYQLDASAARKYGGTGLGLYISKNIIDAFKGKIWIESELGKGTTVHLLLPIAK